VDPYSPWLHSRLAWALHLDGQKEESLQYIRTAVAEYPENEGTYIYGATILAFNGDSETAIKLAQQLTRRLPYFDLAMAVQAYTLACAGRVADAASILDRLQWLSRERYVLNTFTPAVHVVLGNHDAALAELRAAAEIHCPWFFQMLADPRLEPLHDRPEFADLKSILTRVENVPAQN
jgi:tetratricopeptide (TPR) repeat protein